jgi:hypothetical protein
MTFRSSHDALQRRVDNLVDDVRERDHAIARLKARPRWTATAKWRAAVMGLAGLGVALTIVAAWLWRPAEVPAEQYVRRWAPPHAPVERAAPLLVGDHDGDGVDEWVGRFDGLAPRGRYIGMFDGATRRLQWRLGPWDTLREPRHVAFSDERISIIEGAEVVTHHLSDGSTDKRLEVPGEVITVCQPPDRKGPLWLQIAGDRHGLLHAAEGTFMEAPSPQWCKNRGVALAPKIAGYKAHVALVEGDAIVALADHGPMGPALLGFRAGDAATRWSRPVATDAPTSVGRGFKPGEHAVLRDGRVVLAYFHRPSNKTRLEALDAETGDTLWQTETPYDLGDSARALVVGPSQVLLAHDTLLSFFDVRTGKHRGTLGEH